MKKKIKKIPRWIVVCLLIGTCFILYQVIEKPYEKKYFFYDDNLHLETQEIVRLKLILLGGEDVFINANNKTIMYGPKYASFYANPIERNLISKLFHEDVNDYEFRIEQEGL